MKLIVIASLSLAAHTSYAGDSTWMLCKGVADHGKPTEKMYVATSVLEHRAANGTDRQLEVTFIKGDRVSHGTVSQKGALETRGIGGKKHLIFKGTAVAKEDLSGIELTGTLDPTYGDDPKAAREAFHVKLSCDTLDDLAIGH